MAGSGCEPGYSSLRSVLLSLQFPRSRSMVAVSFRVNLMVTPWVLEDFISVVLLNLQEYTFSTKDKN